MNTRLPIVVRFRTVGFLLGVAAPLLVGAQPTGFPPTATDDARPNLHRQIAGELRDGAYTLALELRRTTWRPNAPSALDLEVPAFAEVGQSASIPGPLIRVSAVSRWSWRDS